MAILQSLSKSPTFPRVFQAFPTKTLTFIKMHTDGRKVTMHTHPLSSVNIHTYSAEYASIGLLTLFKEQVCMVTRGYFQRERLGTAFPGTK